MEQTYRDMNELLLRDRNAAEYFDELPSYVQDQIRGRAKNVDSMDALCAYAETLIHGG